MFTLEQVTEIRGDETAGHKVILSRECTVREFINQVLSDKRGWGNITVDRVYGTFRYSHGEIENDPLWKIMDKKVKSATASGGWSRMDYHIIIKNKGNEST